MSELNVKKSKTVRTFTMMSKDVDSDHTSQKKALDKYVKAHSDWEADGITYDKTVCTGSANGVDVVDQILSDAGNGEFDILVIYSMDVFGEMWDLFSLVTALKKYGVDIYSVQEGRITPDMDDISESISLFGMSSDLANPEDNTDNSECISDGVLKELWNAPYVEDTKLSEFICKKLGFEHSVADKIIAVVMEYLEQKGIAIRIED